MDTNPLTNRDSSNITDRPPIKKRGNQVNQSEMIGTNRGKALNHMTDVRESYNVKPSLPDISPIRQLDKIIINNNGVNVTRSTHGSKKQLAPLNQSV